MLFSIIGSTLLYIFRDEVKKGTDIIFSQAKDTLFFTIEIDVKMQHKSVRAIKKEIAEKERSRYVAIDSKNNPRYEIANGEYCLKVLNKADNKLKSVYVFIDTDTIKLTVFRKDIDDYKEWRSYVFDAAIFLKQSFSLTKEEFILTKDHIPHLFLTNYLNSLHLKHCKAADALCFYGSYRREWSTAVFRKTRNINKLTITNDMQKVLDDVHRFINSPQKYHSKGRPYRRGYLLEGEPGTGKTTIVEIVATKYERPIYTITLNQNKMCDQCLKDLINLVPAESIIVIDEIEDQITAAMNNPSNSITLAGIKTSIDGPERMSYGTLIFATTNSLSKLSEPFKKALMRKGRFDKHYKLETLLS